LGEIWGRFWGGSVSDSAKKGDFGEPLRPFLEIWGCLMRSKGQMGRLFWVSQRCGSALLGLGQTEVRGYA